MNKKSKFIVFIIQLIGIIFLGSRVYAKPILGDIKYIDADLYYVSANANGGTIWKYVVGRPDNLNNGISFATSSNGTYITLPNGQWEVWVVNTDSSSSDHKTINVTRSCSNTSADGKTDTGSYERCYERYRDGHEKATTSAAAATCAVGYNMDAAYSTIYYNDCGNKNVSSTGLQYRYCSKKYNYKCVKAAGGNASGNQGNSSYGNAKLSSLTISTGSLSPNFSPSVYSYSATTSEPSVSVGASLASGSASFITGYGPRDVSLGYGLNTIQIKTQDGNTTNSYTIRLKRSDGRSSTNTLASLNVSSGSLSPEFSPLNNAYNIEIEDGVESIDISATLSDSSSSFVEGYGPRTVKVKQGFTRETIKVKSQSGNVTTYTLMFATKGGVENKTSSEKAILESLELSAGTIDFDSYTFDYNISVPNDVTNVSVRANAKNSNDKVVVAGGENLESDKLNEITVTVTSEDGEATNVYTVYVTRKEEDLPISNNSLLSSLEIEGYKIKFDAKKNDYSINIKDGVSQLNINATPADDKSTISIEGNEKLTNGSKVKIRVTAEDGSYTDYYIEVKVVGKGGNVVLTILVIILIIAVLAYLVLRAMGYKIYFNIDGIKQFVSNITKKK